MAASQITVTPLLSLDNNGATLTVQIVPPSAQGSRTPSNICCVVDVSGSMGDTASVKGEGGESQSFGFSILDIVKHSVKTIINILDSNDNFSLVSFTDEAKVELSLTKMDDDGKRFATKKLEELKPLRTTNIWDGLKKGLEVLNGATDSKPCHVILLTDGVPNRSPSEGEVKALHNYMKDHTETSRYTINTFGFGYNLNSPLLCGLAEETKGQFVFIPDSALVGTVFVHAISNLLCTIATNFVVEVEVDKGVAQILTPSDQLESSGGILSYFSRSSGNTTSRFVLGSVLHGQQRELILSLKPHQTELQPHIKVSAHCFLPTEKEQTSIECNPTELVAEDKLLELQLIASQLRSEFPSVISVAVEQVKAKKEADKVIQDSVKPFIEKIEGLKKKVEAVLEEQDDDDKKIAKIGERVVALLTDVSGEGCLALKPQNFGRWGAHYLPSLALAHKYQIRNNFKDPGVQFYGGELFDTIKADAEKIFLTLPAPTPSKRSSSVSSSSVSSSSGSGTQSMTQFYNSANPCFHGNCLVSMADGSLQQLSKVQRGNHVLTGAQQSASVVCLVETLVPEGQGVAFVQPPNSKLRVTPWHPIRVNGEWRFPADVSQEAELIPKIDLECRSVFSLVLDTHHVAVIDGIECVCLGHGFTDNTVVTHEYLGTQKVVQDLAGAPGFAAGRVVLSGVKRDEMTGRICGLVF
eukprot:c9716_g1_i1.p1 GENE.c9716_g1_i1~~c9716_g1_i1.p1  ORF type:complete len:720 (+),score=170.48 c9716_g1_i1:77-2161(+)